MKISTSTTLLKLFANKILLVCVKSYMFTKAYTFLYIISITMFIDFNSLLLLPLQPDITMKLYRSVSRLFSRLQPVALFAVWRQDKSTATRCMGPRRQPHRNHSLHTSANCVKASARKDTVRLSLHLICITI